MEEKAVLLEISGAVATLTLNRPGAMNSLNKDLVDDLLEALTTAEANPQVRVVVLTGAGKAFCAGGDLMYLSTLTNQIQAHQFIAQAGKITATIMGLSKPVIAMVNGVAAGAGFNLAMACDLVVAAKSVKFAQSFAKVGLVPDCGGFYLLPRVVGMHKAKELMFTADLIDAETALRLGIVNVLTDEAELAGTVARLAERLANGAPIALSCIKKMVNRSDSLDLKNTLAFEEDMQAICMQTADYQEGVKAFKEKRPPVFRGE